MTEEQAFLSAIVANPDDRTVKLVYADRLADRDVFLRRGHCPRLKVQILYGTPHENTPEARARSTELERTALAKWLVLLDGPVWCAAGNARRGRARSALAVRKHATVHASSNQMRRSTLADVWHSSFILEPEPARWHNVRVVGRHRKVGGLDRLHPPQRVCH